MVHTAYLIAFKDIFYSNFTVNKYYEMVFITLYKLFDIK